MGIDVSTTAIKAVRMRRSGTDVTISALSILPPPEAASAGQEPGLKPIRLTKALRANYAAVALSSPGSLIKLLSFPGAFDQQAESEIESHMGIEKGSPYRIGYKVLSLGHGRSESKVLAVAMPEDQARVAIQLFPSGTPAPCSIENSGLAAVTAFLHAAGIRDSKEATGVMDFGARQTVFAIFSGENLVLVRRFDFGTEQVFEKVRQALGVDAQTAEQIILQGSFDISQPLGEVMQPFIKQLVVSRDFVERRENCHVRRVLVSGGGGMCKPCLAELKSALEADAEAWDPLKAFPIAAGAADEASLQQGSRFAAAIGAALAAMEPA